MRIIGILILVLLAAFGCRAATETAVNEQALREAEDYLDWIDGRTNRFTDLVDRVNLNPYDLSDEIAEGRQLLRELEEKEPPDFHHQSHLYFTRAARMFVLGLEAAQRGDYDASELFLGEAQRYLRLSAESLCEESETPLGYRAC